VLSVLLRVTNFDYPFPTITVGVTCGAETAYPSKTPEFILSFNRVRVTQFLSFCVVVYRSVFFILCCSFGHCIVCPLIPGF
jgi:hypothetical protein